ncbi:MAG: metalloregulator ArsR/SmtB family transcription factor [Bacteroidetes bacterium]|nr:metalloregulator ArsR/SmtB family transcription factor [Bacteroidota bacterium]
MSQSTGIVYNQDDILVARIAKALGHPARISILKYLHQVKKCSCQDIVDQMPIAQATVSQHLRELKNAGLINASFEPPKVMYYINQENWEKAGPLILNFLKLY